MTAVTLLTAQDTAPASASASPQPDGAGAGRRVPGELRLTRRGRLVVTISLLVLVAVVAVLFSSRSVATSKGGEPEPTRTVVVERGDTLWQIAAAVAPDGEVREMVHRIEKINALPGPALVEGQEVAVPLG